jgi:serine protease AprX
MNLVFCNQTRRKAVWGPKRTVLAALAALVVASPPAAAKGVTKHAHASRWGGPNRFVHAYKMDRELENRARDAEKRRGLETTRVIVELDPKYVDAPQEVLKFGRLRLKLGVINGQVIEVPNTMLKKLAAAPGVLRLHYDRPIQAHNYRTSVTTGARLVQDWLGYTGAGVGVAIIDSGITSWHDDLTNRTSKIFPYGNQRVSKFVDFVNGRTLPYDDNGHGTHVAGVIGGNGYDSFGEKTGIAPSASLVSLKVLDAAGQGTVSNIIAALNWVAVNGKTYNVRVVNMSVGAGVYESYWTDPLTLAAKAVVDRGITVVAAAGNFGKDREGRLQYGAITAPGNAPWVLTVGASSTMGTLTRSDDQMTDFSSSGPTAVDFLSKPDLVAPGAGTVSLSAPGSTLYLTKALNLLGGVLGLGGKPYLALSGTSMAAPVVTGTVALMLQANPNLTPNLIKAILQYTSQRYPGYNSLRQGAGFLNSYGAVRLAKYFANPRAGDRMPVQAIWSRQIIWGNHRLSGGTITPNANAWANNIVWGMAKTMGDTGDNIVWGMQYDGDNIVWGMHYEGDNIVWGMQSDGDNIVWGMHVDGDNIVWGMANDGDNIVWGMDCGGSDCDDVVWGTATGDGDNIVWGTAQDGDNIVWGMAADGDNIVWGMSADGSDTWASEAEDEPTVIYPDTATEPLPSVDLEFGDIVPPATTTTESSLLGGGL